MKYDSASLFFAIKILTESMSAVIESFGEIEIICISISPLLLFDFNF